MARSMTFLSSRTLPGQSCPAIAASARGPKPGHSSQPSTAAMRVPKYSASTSISPSRARSGRSEEHTSELQSLMRISYAVFFLKKKKKEKRIPQTQIQQKKQEKAHRKKIE